MSILPLGQVRGSVAASLAVAILIGFTMVGCGTLQTTSQTPPPPNSTCNSAQQCKVLVVVTCTSGICAITSPVKTDNIDANGFDVVWEIVPSAGQSYTFKNPGGIFFKDSAGQQLFNCGPEMDGKRFQCHSTTKDAKSYQYGIELVGSPPVSKLDPWIVNR